MKPLPTPHAIFPIPAAEALQFKTRAQMGEDWIVRYLDEEPSPFWKYELRACLDKWTAFAALGDTIIIGKPHAIIRPEERNEDGVEPPADRWELQFWPEDYHVIEPTNRGLSTHRIAPEEPDELALFERSFSEEWESINRALPGAGHGLGHLQDIILMRCRNREHPAPPELRTDLFAEYVTQRERLIVADVIQWLGSGVGRAFLNQVNRRTGGKLAASI